MKQNIRKLIALALVLCMVVPMAPTANAFGWGSWGSSWWGSSWRDQNSNDDPGMALALVEDQDTVSEDVEMRAAVYAADESDPVAQAELEGNNVVYYPSTFVNYDLPNMTSGINQSMADLDVQYAVDNGLSTDEDDWSWKGLYFGAGGSGGTVSDREEAERTGTAATNKETYTKASVTYNNLTSSDGDDQATNYYYYDEDTDAYYRVTVTRDSQWQLFRTTYTYTLKANGKQIWSGSTTSTGSNFTGVILFSN